MMKRVLYQTFPSEQTIVAPSRTRQLHHEFEETLLLLREQGADKVYIRTEEPDGNF
jgi:hypothetical protein